MVGSIVEGRKTPGGRTRGINGGLLNVEGLGLRGS